jgi:hypothetical protein
MRHFNMVQKKLPARILIFRAGVSHGELDVLRETEINPFAAKLQVFYWTCYSDELYLQYWSATEIIRCTFDEMSLKIR